MPKPDSQLDRFVFFTDENLGRHKVPDGLREAGLRVVKLYDHFATGTPDREWLPEVGRRGWVLVTKDERIRHNPAERLALAEAKMHAIFLGTQGLAAEAQVEVLCKGIASFAKLVDKAEGAVLVVVRKSGDVVRLN